MPYLSFGNSRNRATLIAALLIIEFLAILWMKDSGPSPTQPHYQRSPQQQRQGQDVEGQSQGQRKKIKDSKMKATTPRFLKGGAGVEPYHVNDEQWDFSMRATRPERKRSEGSEEHRGPEIVLLPKGDRDQTGDKASVNVQSSSLAPPPPLLPPSTSLASPQDNRPIDTATPPIPMWQTQQQREPSVSRQPPVDQSQGHYHHRTKTPDPAPSVSDTGISPSEQQKGGAKEKKLSTNEPIRSKGNNSVAFDVTKDSQGSVKSAKDEKSRTMSSTTKKAAKGNSKLSKKQREQRQLQRQQRVQEKNQRGRFKSTKERKLAQLIPALDEYGVIIEDHFISPRDSDGDGVPDYYVLLRPSSSIDTAADIGLFDDEVVKAQPHPTPLTPPGSPIAPTPNAQEQPTSLAPVTISAKNGPSQTSLPFSSEPTNMPLASPVPLPAPSPPPSSSLS
ncbi:hypothetical protein EMPS_03071 [Entomortierella parvispora]|uniref:Uncharacterized protein n=1 Tax=Entomortierella parvispora TaxID=205924 RepID=A0A9P3LU29_9FUNG|nr:hypothetical protein EMPS_03071 [Entomortierella parvispora]